MGAYTDHILSLAPESYVDWGAVPSEDIGLGGTTVPGGGGSVYRVQVEDAPVHTDGYYSLIGGRSGYTIRVSGVDTSLPRNSYSISLWIKFNKMPDDSERLILEWPRSGGGEILRVTAPSRTSNELLRIDTRSLSARVGDESMLGEWLHLTITKQEGDVGAMVWLATPTGMESHEITNTGSVSNSQNIFNVGFGNVDDDDFYVSEFAMFSRALSEEEIRSMSVDYTVEKDVDFGPEPATAESDMVMPARYGAADVTIAAEPMHASAFITIPFTHEDTYVVHAKSPLVEKAGEPVITRTVAIATNRPDIGSDAIIHVPDLTGLLESPRDEYRLHLRLTRNSGSGTGTAGLAFRRYNDDGTWSSLGSAPYNSTQDVLLPQGTDHIRLQAPSIFEGYDFRLWVENPAYGSGATGSYFTLMGFPDTGAYPEADVSTGEAEMLDAEASIFIPHATVTADLMEGAAAFAAPVTSTGTSVSIPVLSSSASGEMTKVVFPDWEQQVAPATGAGEMEDSWFKSEYRFRADSVTIDGEMLDPTTVAERDIVLEVASMHGEGNIFNPDEVSDDVNDRFFDEIAKDRPNVWRRFNERVHEPAGAYAHNYNGRLDLREFTGEYTRGHVGVGGRRAIDIDNAFLPTPGVFPTRTTYHNQHPSALEFVIKTTADHGILAAYTSNWTYLGGAGGDPSVPASNSSTFIKDGYLFQQRGNENDHIRLSASRINDGQWHHIVLNSVPSPFTNLSIRNRQGIEVWIDGVRDRTVFRGETVDHVNPPGADHLFAPGRWADDYTSIPFKGQVMEFAGYTKSLHEDRILAHWRALADIIPVKAGRPATGIGAMGDHEVESNMRRMLILNFSRTWGRHLSGQTGPWQLFTSPGLTSNNRSHLSINHQFGKDWIPNVLESMDVTDPDDIGELGDLQITYQRVEMVHDSETYRQGWSAVGWDAAERGHSGSGVYFIDDFTGQRRFINLQQDIVDLEDYDILYVQGYPNPTLRDQQERQKYEAFLASLKQAIVDGSKLWISNPLLAADLGLISRHEIVPTTLAYKNTLDGRIYRRGPVPIMEAIDKRETSSINDARSWQLYPWNDKEAPLEIPEGIETNAQMYAHLRNVAPTVAEYLGEISSHRYAHWDAWANNMYRVINEIDGLTDFPSYEVESAAIADRVRTGYQDASSGNVIARRYENRTGEDDPWGYTENQGLGLKPGDEFIDHHIFDDAWRGMGNGDRGRGYITHAVPPGHLKSGRAVTTFGSTVWQDNGKEGVNPYKDYITTAAVVPGDRIDGQLIGGYVFMQFSEDAHRATKLKYLTIDRNPWIEGEEFGWNLDELEGWAGDGGRQGVAGVEGLTDYARSWHYAIHRMASQSRGSVEVVTGGQFRLVPVTDSSGGTSGHKVISMGPVRSENLPLAPRMQWRHGTVSVPHTTWTFRGIRWLMNATPKLVGAVNTLAEASEATGRMLEPSTYSEKDNQINVAPANAYGVLLASDNAVGKDAMHFAIAATGTARIVDPGRTIFVEPMTSIGDMGSQNIARIELGEINWLTLSLNRDLIELRVGEVGASTSSLLTIPGEVINTGGN